MLACSQPPSPMTTQAWPPILPLSQVDFSCRLPVLDVSKPGVNDAFITFPAGTLTPAGTDGWNYDWAVERWLPVGRNAISPDGRRYAIARDWSPGPPAPTRVHVVDAATGADLRVTVMPDSRQYAVADFTSSGISVVDPASGTEDYEFLLVLGPGRVASLAGYSGQQLSLYHDLAFTTGLADDHGIWMSGSDSLYLIQSTGAISRVSDHAGVPVNACR